MDHFFGFPLPIHLTRQSALVIRTAFPASHYQIFRSGLDLDAALVMEHLLRASHYQNPRSGLDFDAALVIWAAFPPSHYQNPRSGLDFDAALVIEHLLMGISLPNFSQVRICV